MAGSAISAMWILQQNLQNHPDKEDAHQEAQFSSQAMHTLKFPHFCSKLNSEGSGSLALE